MDDLKLILLIGGYTGYEYFGNDDEMIHWSKGNGFKQE